MLWVLKRTVSMRRFFLAPKTYVKTDQLENIYNFMLKFFCLSKPMGYYILINIQKMNSFFEFGPREQPVCDKHLL